MVAERSLEKDSSMDSSPSDSSVRPSASDAPAAPSTPSTPPLPPATGPDEPSPTESTPSPRGEFNEAQVQDIALGRTVHAQASRTEHTATLGLAGVQPEFIGLLGQLVGECTRRMVATVTGRSETREDTSEAAVALKALIVGLKGLQSAAKQYASMAKAQGKAFSTDGYLLAQPLAPNRDVVLLNAAALRTKAVEDQLPGVDTEALKAFDILVDTYSQTRDTQTTGKEEAGLTRLGRDQLISRLNAATRAIQHAIDRRHPHEDPANAPIRKTFGLPPDRRLKE